jgi:hypothetical protein
VTTTDALPTRQPLTPPTGPPDQSPPGASGPGLVYDAFTRSEVDAPQAQAALRSLFEDLGGNGETVDLFFGPEQPAGAEGRWIQTLPGRGWFTHFRIYGPASAAFDGSWKPSDLRPT